MKYSAEEIGVVLTQIDPLLNGYPKEVVEGFREVLLHPKNRKEKGKADMVLTLAKGNVNYKIIAEKDNVITPDEKGVLKLYSPALKENVRAIIFEVQKQIEAKKQKELAEKQKEAPKKSFWQKVVEFIRNPKTVAAASVIIPAHALAEEIKSDITDNKAPVEIYYSPQSVDEAMKSAVELMKKIKEETSPENNNIGKESSKASSVRQGGGIER